jgi:two-component system osmolarity sensor histidine kinase EnvZ
VSMPHRPRTLFARTGLSLAAALGIFLVLTITIVVLLVMVPIARQGADDLAVIMMFAAKTWVELPPVTRPDFEHELLDNYRLKFSSAATELPRFSSALPFLMFLEQALEKRLGQPVVIMQSRDQGKWYWADIQVAGRKLRVGIAEERIGAHPPLALLLIVVAGALIIVITSLLLARRLTKPLVQLSATTEQIARGEQLSPLPETGPREIVTLVRSFNRMAREIAELLANRTTLLAGISHDLRTPITRARLALELLPAETAPDLVAGVQRDLEEMERLIGQALEFARGLDVRPPDEIDLQEFVDGIVADYTRGAACIEWAPAGHCMCEVQSLALRRVIVNLLDNAIRYGGGMPVEVGCECVNNKATVRILDRGPGIPVDRHDAVLRPFFRLETSRSRETGGSGLGLAIAQQLSQTYGWVLSLLARKGGGTEAVLEFPTRVPSGSNRRTVDTH